MPDVMKWKAPFGSRAKVNGLSKLPPVTEDLADNNSIRPDRTSSSPWATVRISRTISWNLKRKCSLEEGTQFAQPNRGGRVADVINAE